MSGVIVLDGSALFAILLGETEAIRCQEALRSSERILLSAGSLTELLIVAAAKKVGADMDTLLDLVRPDIVPVTATRARGAADAYRLWGKGFHPAGLNICDSFAYALAIEEGCPLLYIGDDFAETDVVSALA